MEEVAEVRALEEDDRRVVAREVDGCRVGLGRRQVEHPVVAVPVVRERQPRREHVLTAERETPPGEVDRLERAAVDRGRVLEERTELIRERRADLVRELVDLRLREPRLELERDLVAVLIHEARGERALDLLDGVHEHGSQRRL